MERVVRSVLEALDRAVDVIGAWVRGAGAGGPAGAEAFDPLQPGTWSAGFWLLVGAFLVLVVLAAYRRRTRPPPRARAPELLVTRGEVVPDPGVRRSGAGTVTMTVSNLSRYPVQVLEVAVRTGRGKRFGVAEVGALVPAMGEVEVATRIPVGRLEDGVLDVYAYAAVTKVKTFRHRAELVWEPWAKRFKVAPLEQRIVPTKVLASARQDVIRLVEEAEPPVGGWATVPPPEPAGPEPSGRRSLEVRLAAVASARTPVPDEPPVAPPSGRRDHGTPRPADTTEAPHDGAPEPGPAQLFAMLDERPPLAGSRRATSAQVLALNELLVTDAEVEEAELDVDDAPGTAVPVATADAAVVPAVAPAVAPLARRAAPSPRSGAEARASRAARTHPDAEPRDEPSDDVAPPGDARDAARARAPRPGPGPEPRPPRPHPEREPLDGDEDRSGLRTAERAAAPSRRPGRPVGRPDDDEPSEDEFDRPRRRPGSAPLEFPDEF